MVWASAVHKNVVDVFRGKIEPETDGREGLKSLELLSAVYLAARDDKILSTKSSRILVDKVKYMKLLLWIQEQK